MKTKFNEFMQIDDNIKKVIDKINEYPNKITIRKSNKYINNIIVNSTVCEFYKNYYLFIGQKTNKIPVPDKIYDYEDLFLKIDLELSKNINGLYVAILNHLKSYLIYVSYFPHILEIRNNEWEKKFLNMDFISYLYKLFDSNEDIKDEVCEKNGYINHHIFFADSFEEIRIIKKIIGRF
jgi:hypothetical protein